MSANPVAEWMSASGAGSGTVTPCAIRLLDDQGSAAVLIAHHVRGQSNLGPTSLLQVEAVLFLTYPPAVYAVDKERFQRVFGLTPAEARLAEHLVLQRLLAP